jgi:hypothetical protein
MEKMRRRLRVSDRARERLVRMAIWTSAVTVLAAMAFGEDHPSMESPASATPVAASVYLDPIGAGRLPAPSTVARALQQAGLHVSIARGKGRGALISNAGHRQDEGTLNVEFMGADGLSAPSTAWPPTACMTIRADLGTEAWVTYAPALLDAGLNGECVRSNTDFTTPVLNALKSAAGSSPAAP